MQPTTLNPAAAHEARTASQHLAKVQNGKLEFQTSQGQTFSIPSEVIPVFQEVLEQLSNERAVLVLALDSELSTFEAADLLGVSRPFVKKLLEKGKIPFRMVGTHHRVRLADVLKYQEQQHQDSLEAMAELTTQAQELGLYSK
jgi:excisionase family DNA binding protein